MGLTLALAKLLGALKTTGAERTLLDLLRDKDSEVKIAVLRALGRFGGPDCMEALRQEAAAYDPIVSFAAQIAISQVLARGEHGYRSALRGWKEIPARK
ncbi:MAG: HEAT repeat domain-containing protein [Elusimicrobiota bacterium]|jgi:HEAT repeat protein